MKKITLLLVSLLAMCNVAVAQWSQFTMSTQTDYLEVDGHRVKDTFEKQFFSTEPYIGEYRHGGHTRYVDGKLRASFNWRYDMMTSCKVYYPNGQVWFQGTIIQDEGLFKSYTEYNKKGGVVRQYTMKKISGDWYYESYTDKTWKLTSSGKVATITNKSTGASYTYNYETKVVNIKNDPTIKFYNNDNKAVLKNGTVSYEIVTPVSFLVQGYGFELKKGDKGSFKFKHEIKLRSILGTEDDHDPLEECGVVNFDNAIEAYVTNIDIPRFQAGLDLEDLLANCQPSTMVTFLNGSTYELHVVSGDVNNGVLKLDALEATAKDSRIVSFKLDSLNATSGAREIWDATRVETEYNEEQQGYHLYMVEGTKTIIDKDGGKITFTGEFEKNNFVGGQSIVADFSEGGDATIMYGNTRQNLNAKKIVYTCADNKFYIENKSGMTFEGQLPNFCIKDILCPTIKFNTKGNHDVTGKCVSDSGLKSFEGSFIHPYFLLRTSLGTLVCKEGIVDFRSDFGRYTGEFSNNQANGRGMMTINNVGTITGEFANDQFRKDVESVVDFALPTGESFKGKMLGGKYHGKGELRLANGDYYIGEFIGGKFSGTGEVRYTHSKGVYEGKVINFECQYDTPQDNAALKKIKAPKMPKVKIPSIIGELY